MDENSTNKTEYRTESKEDVVKEFIPVVKEFLKDTIVLLLILGNVIFLYFNNKIDNCTLGTLLGSIIGYSIGNFKSNNSNH